MSHHQGLEQWTEIVSSQMPHLSKTQAAVLALYSFGVVMMQSSGMRRVSVFLGALLGRKENSVRQQLREFCYDADDKRGEQRQEIEVTVCFGGLVSWVLAWWGSGEQRLALALDATSLGQRFTVLALSVVYRGCAVPVAWAIVPGTQSTSWRWHWQGLLDTVAQSVPQGWTVIVLADRGLYARWLFQHIVRLHWHPFLRINQQGQFRLRHSTTFQPLKTVVQQDGIARHLEIVCFKTPKAQLSCTLLAQWEADYTDPWLILTDLLPTQATTAWYGLRTWIEAGFKDLKRGGWHWHQTAMTDPARAERLWLVLSIATLWVLSVGGQAEYTLCAAGFDPLPLTPLRSRPRLLSCFARGMALILAAFFRADPCPIGSFFPEPWASLPGFEPVL